MKMRTKLNIFEKDKANYMIVVIAFKYVIYASVIIFFINSQDIYAFSTYYNQNPQGWHWNNLQGKNSVDEIEKLKKIKNQSEKTMKDNKNNNPIEEMSRVHLALKYAKDRAVLNPTVENIREYLMIQNMVMDQSTRFSKNWRKTMLLYPEFDYGVSHPTDSAISQIVQSNLHNKKATVAKLLAHQFGLLFFYEGSNPLSTAMAKTVKQFSQFYGFSTIAVSVDHTIIPNLLPTRIDSGQARNLGVKALPALVLVNPKTGQHQILTYGYASINELLTDCYNVYVGNIN